MLALLHKPLVVLSDSFLQLTFFLIFFLVFGFLRLFVLHFALQILEEVVDLGFALKVLLFYKPFVLAHLHMLLQRFESLHLCPELTLKADPLLNLRQKSLVHLDLLKFPLSNHLFFEEAPGSEHLRFVPEQLSFERLIEGKLEAGRVELHGVEALRLEKSLLSLSYRVKSDDKLVNVEVPELLLRCRHFLLGVFSFDF